MAAARRRHHGGSRTLVHLLCWAHLLLSTQPCIRADGPQTHTTHGSTMKTPQIPPVSGHETTPDEDELTGSTMKILQIPPVPVLVTTPDEDELTGTTNVSQQLQWALNVCPNNICKHRCGSNISDKYCLRQTCNCDMRCRLFKDCCPDFEEVCPLEATESFLEAHIKMHSHRMSYMKHEVIQQKSVKSIQWVGKCPEGEDHASIALCESSSAFSAANYNQHIPVIYDGFIFKNRYCAMCHGVLHSYSPIRFMIVCKDFRVQTELVIAMQFNDFSRALDIAGQHCSIEYKLQDFPTETRRFLYYSNTPYTNSCPSLSSAQKSERQDDVCQLYQSVTAGVVDGIYKVFNNPHCALCNDIFPHNATSLICGIDTCKTSSSNPPGPVRSFGILVDVTSEHSKMLRYDTAISDIVCLHGHINDDLKEECVATNCHLGFVTNGTGCFRAYDKVPQIFNDRVEDYTIVLLYTGHSHLDVLDFHNRAHSFPHIEKLISLDYDVKCTALPLKAFSFLPESTECECYVIKVALQVPLKFNPPTLRRVRAVFDDGYQPFKMFVFNYDTSKNLECKEGRGIYTDEAVMHTPVDPAQNVFVRNVGYTWPRFQVPVMIFQDRGNLSYQDAQLQVLVKVCIKHWEDGDDNSLNSNIKGILTLTGNVISLAALVLALISFIVITRCKGIIRILLINLMVALFISQLTFLIAEVLQTSTLICRVVAVFQHYSWLAYFFLMNATALEMAWRFRSLKGMVMARKQRSNRGRLTCLLVYGCMGPLLLVIPSVILDVMDNLDLSPRYGMEMGCWLNNKSALLYFFVIPFSIIVSFNTLLILFTIIRIKISASQNHMLSLERSVYQINIRLSTLMGLSWMLGLIASYTKLEALWYAFIVINTLQGAILFFSFTFPRLTIKNLRASRALSILSRDRAGPAAYRTQSKLTTTEERF